jgi:hypothetical protein
MGLFSKRTSAQQNTVLKNGRSDLDDVLSRTCFIDPLMTVSLDYPKEILDLMVFAPWLLGYAIRKNQVELLARTVYTLKSIPNHFPREYWWLVENNVVDADTTAMIRAQSQFGWPSPVTIFILAKIVDASNLAEALHPMECIDPFSLDFASTYARYVESESGIQRLGAPPVGTSEIEKLKTIGYDPIKVLDLVPSLIRREPAKIIDLFTAPLLKEGRTPEECNVFFGTDFTDNEEYSKGMSRLTRIYRGQSKEMDRKIIKLELTFENGHLVAWRNRLAEVKDSVQSYRVTEDFLNGGEEDRAIPELWIPELPLPNYPELWGERVFAAFTSFGLLLRKRGWSEETTVDLLAKSLDREFYSLKVVPDKVYKWPSYLHFDGLGLGASNVVFQKAYSWFREKLF